MILVVLQRDTINDMGCERLVVHAVYTYVMKRSYHKRPFPYMTTPFIPSMSRPRGAMSRRVVLGVDLGGPPRECRIARIAV